MDIEVFDDVCAPSFSEAGLGNRLDESTDFFALRIGGECTTPKFSSHKQPLADVQNNLPPPEIPLIEPEKVNEVIELKLISEPVSAPISAPASVPVSALTTVPANNPPEGVQELENLGRLAMFGNRPQVKRRSQLKKEMLINSTEKVRKPMAPSQPVLTASKPRDPVMARKSTSIRSRSPSVDRAASSRVAKVEEADRRRASIRADASNARPKAFVGPMTRARSRESANKVGTQTKDSTTKLSDRMSKMDLSSKSRAPIIVASSANVKKVADVPSEREFRRGIVEPRLSSTPVSKSGNNSGAAAPPDPSINMVRKPPTIPHNRRSIQVQRSNSLKPVARSPVVVSASPQRRTPAPGAAKSRVAFGSAVRRSVTSTQTRRSAIGSPGNLRSYPPPSVGSGCTPRRVLTIPDTPQVLRRAPSLTRCKDTPTQSSQTQLPQSARLPVSAQRKSRIDVASLVDRLSKPKNVASPRRNPAFAGSSRVANVYTHGIKSATKPKRSRSNSLVNNRAKPSTVLFTNAATVSVPPPATASSNEQAI